MFGCLVLCCAVIRCVAMCCFGWCDFGFLWVVLGWVVMCYCVFCVAVCCSVGLCWVVFGWVGFVLYLVVGCRWVGLALTAFGVIIHVRVSLILSKEYSSCGVFTTIRAFGGEQLN